MRMMPGTTEPMTVPELLMRAEAFTPKKFAIVVAQKTIIITMKSQARLFAHPGTMT